ncbi:MAG: PHP domain-containing protein [Novosphingobium sp.]|nr:PHP domain-containing protein [Novosphingobium sp.]
MNNLPLAPIPLHNHSSFDKLDGMLKYEDMISFCKENKLKSLCITQHGKFEGWLKFIKECKKNDIKPIVGFEAYVLAPLEYIECQDKKTGKAKIKEKRIKSYHMTFIPKTYEALVNLFKLNNKYVYKEYYGKGRVTVKFQIRDILRLKDTYVLSGCLNSPINRVDNKEELIKLFKKYLKENFYLEIQTFTEDDQVSYNMFLSDMSKKYNIPLVVTSDSHYKKESDAIGQRYMMASSMKKKVSEMDYFKTNDFHLHTTGEVLGKLTYLEKGDIVNSIMNTHKIADSVNQEFDTSKIRLPEFTGEIDFWFK